jgi:hypothetical protein
MKFIKVAAPPPPGLSGGDPMAMLGADMGMGGIGGMPPMPTAPTAMPGPTKKVIRQPLDNLGLILADVDIEKILQEYLGSDELEIANEIWEMYGGNEEGSVIESNVGERVKNKEATDEQIENTQDSKWKRLPEGKTMMTLNPPVTLDKLYNAVKYMSFGIAKNKSKEQGAGGPGGGGGMPGLASHNYKNMVKIARILDKLGHYSISDRLMP